ncbi:MAG: ribbon-helix-helix domain-containing protein [Candidatus Firestonebacteria bacterium]
MAKQMLIYIQEEQKNMLSDFSKVTKKSVSELVREAIDSFLERYKKKPVSLSDALRISSGAWKGREDIKDTEMYVRKIRKEFTESFEKKSNRYAKKISA